MTQPYRIIDLSPFSLPLKGTELIEVSDGGNGSFKLPLASALPGTAYYVNGSTGNDGNGGTSPSAPIQTITKVNSLTLQPGDAVLFAGGQTYSGAIVCPSAGTPANPITFGSYGGGQATISSGTSNGFSSTNQAGIVVRDLTFSGSASANYGVFFTNTLASNVHLQNIQCINLNISGYGRDGILVNGNNGTAGYDDVLIQGCVVTSCCAAAAGTLPTAGIHVTSLPGYGLAGSGNSSPSFYNVKVERCIVSNCLGVSGGSTQTGCGILFSEVLQGAISDCEANGNGSNSNTTSGPVAIFAYDCTRVTMTSCRAINQSTALNDGEGFDLDGGCYDCEISNCYAAGNRGAGYLIFSYNDGQVTSNSNCKVVNCVSNADGVAANLPNIIVAANTGAALTLAEVANCATYSTAANAGLGFQGTGASAITGRVINTPAPIVGSVPSGVTISTATAAQVTSGDAIFALQNLASGGKDYTLGSTSTGSAFGGGNLFAYDLTDNFAVFVFKNSTKQFCFSSGETIAFTSDVFGLSPDTGFSRTSAAHVALGNGTAGDVSGFLTLFQTVASYSFALAASGQFQGFFAAVTGDANNRATLGLDGSNNGFVSLGVGGSTAADVFLNRQAAGTFGVGTSSTNNLGTIGAAAFLTSTALVAMGGATPPTFANGVGGAGQPTTAAQNSWVKMKDSTGATIWLPVWK